MIRKAVLTAIFLSFLGCSSGGGSGPLAASECRLTLANHCAEICPPQGGRSVGYIAIIPTNQFRCVCKYPEGEKSGIAF